MDLEEKSSGAPAACNADMQCSTSYVGLAKLTPGNRSSSLPYPNAPCVKPGPECRALDAVLVALAAGRKSHAGSPAELPPTSRKKLLAHKPAGNEDKAFIRSSLDSSTWAPLDTIMRSCQAYKAPAQATNRRPFTMSRTLSTGDHSQHQQHGRARTRAWHYSSTVAEACSCSARFACAGSVPLPSQDTLPKLKGLSSRD